jgi:hypothetical protein
MNSSQDAVLRRGARTALSLALLLVLAAQACTSVPPSSAGLSGDEAISANEIREHVNYLASDALEGRGSGTSGADAAASYIAREFRRYGLEPGGPDGSYYRSFSVTTGVELGPGNRLDATRARGAESGVAWTGVPSTDFSPLSFSGTGTALGEAVFVGYGIEAPDFGYDDYAGVDVAGKVVIALRYEPRERAENGAFGDFRPSRFSEIRLKATIARDRGAAAFVLVTGPLHHEAEGDSLETPRRRGTIGGDVGIPAVHARRGLVEEWLAGTGRDLASVQDVLDRDLRGGSFAVPGLTVKITTDLVVRKAKTSNVVGVLRGANPSFSSEAIVIGAHYDHLGHGGEGSLAPNEEGAIHNGADDNASGTAALLEVARAFTRAKTAPRRSLVFAAFSGEEMGLLGSAEYVMNPTFPIEKTVAMINMDMVGRLREGKLVVGGVGTSPLFPNLMATETAGLDLAIQANKDGMGPSDHQSFYLKDIPVLILFTGLHEDYHKPSDDAARLNSDGARTVARLAYRLAAEIGASESKPPFSKTTEPAAAPTGDMGAARKASLGTVPDYAESESGVRLADVRAGSPAEKSGLRRGDTIIRFAGKTVRNIYDYTYALSARKPGDVVEIVVTRDGMELTVSATLAPGGTR